MQTFQQKQMAIISQIKLALDNAEDARKDGRKDQVSWWEWCSEMLIRAANEDYMITQTRDLIAELMDSVADINPQVPLSTDTQPTAGIAAVDPGVYDHSIISY